MGLGWQEILLIFLVVLIFFGASRIPEIAKSLGKASREFKKARDEITRETEEIMDAAEKHAENAEKKTSLPDGDSEDDKPEKSG